MYFNVYDFGVLKLLVTIIAHSVFIKYISGNVNTQLNHRRV